VTAIKVSIETESGQRETVDLPVPTPPTSDIPGGGHWRWIGPLPRFKITLDDGEYAVCVELVKCSSVMARILTEGEKVGKPGSGDREPGAKGDHVCKDCKRSFETPAQLGGHRSAMHRLAGPPNAVYPCRFPDCDKVFGGPQWVSRHEHKAHPGFATETPIVGRRPDPNGGLRRGENAISTKRVSWCAGTFLSGVGSMDETVSAAGFLNPPLARSLVRGVVAHLGVSMEDVSVQSKREAARERWGSFSDQSKEELVEQMIRTGGGRGG
jgi:hypothetical protein